MNDYQIDVVEYGVSPSLILVVVTLLLFRASRNVGTFKRLLVSAYPMVFVLGEVFSLVASSYYERPIWNGSASVHPEVSLILNRILNSIYILGVIMAVYSIVKFEGYKIFKYLIVPTFIVAVWLVFISSMTLTGDWI